MKKCNLEIDVAKCMSCQNCVIATKDEYHGNEFPGFAKPYAGENGDLITIKRRERGTGANIDVNYLVTMCNHCDDAPCVKAAGDGALYKRDDGITMVDFEKSRGRKSLIDSCPYGAMRWNDAHQVPQMWNFDAHLLDLGCDAPRCVDACPTKALVFHRCTDEDMVAIAEANGLGVLNARLGTKPRVYYKNLHLYTSHFIGGTVTAGHDQVARNVAGAEVTLCKDGAPGAREISDDFGYFRFDGIRDGDAGYALEIAHEGFSRRTITLEHAIKASVNVEIVLEG